MRCLVRNAPPPLDRLIESLWYWEGDPLGHLKDTILPSAGVGLIVNLADDRLRWYDGDEFGVSNHLNGIGIAGPNSRPIAIDAFHRKMMGMQFRAGGAFPFFGLPISALADRHISLADLWGRNASLLQERLVEAPTPSEKFDILLQALKTKASGPLHGHPALSRALQIFASRPRATIVTAAAEAGLSQKNLVKVFSEQVGFRPKLYCRIARFQRVLGQITEAAGVDWGDIVERNGYYDQSHFIHDFGEFSGLSPSVYFKRRGPHGRHVPVPG